MFNELQAEDNLSAFINAAFNIEFPLSGDWGYTQEQATVIEGLPEGMSLNQLEHTLAMMRAQLEMSLTQEESNRYLGINVNEKKRESITVGTEVFEKVTYEVAGMKEEEYKHFVQEYKDGYESNELDLNDHFKRRKEATLIREVYHYFEVSSVS